MEAINTITIYKYFKKGETIECSEKSDYVAVEEPLEVSIIYLENNILINKNVAVTMRTPGNDEALALGFLYTENIIDTSTQVQEAIKKGANKIAIKLQNGNWKQLQKTERNFYTTSSCGVCGKASIEAIHTIHQTPLYPEKINIDASIVLKLRNKLSSMQSNFEATGGMHAVGLLPLDASTIIVFEDVGRHNALDKLIGNAYLQKQLPLQKSILLLSGRASFELIQKAAMASIPIVCAIGAPSSLAIELAIEMDITLIGFLKENSFNVYSGKERVI